MSNDKCIVTTTIQSVQPAIYKLLERDQWDLVIVADTKTPHSEYSRLEKQYFPRVKYLTIEDQERLSLQLSNVIGWRKIERRNLGFLYAYSTQHYSVIGSFDDDNIIHDEWNGETLVGTTKDIQCYSSTHGIIDPFAVLGLSYHHRGFPLEYIKSRRDDIDPPLLCSMTVDVEAPIPEGDPDIDAFTRLSLSPHLSIDTTSTVLPFGISAKTTIAPFNSQCTFLSRDCIPYYMMLIDIGRPQDIFGAYLLQKLRPDTTVLYNKPIARQERNEHDLLKDMQEEVWGYMNAGKYVDSSDPFAVLPKNTVDAFLLYQKECMKYD